MGYYPYVIPDGAVWFIELQFKRFCAPLPSQKVVDKVGDYVITYTLKNSYYPATTLEAKARYDRPGLTEAEKHAILGPLEYELKVKLREEISFDQLHLAAWAALLYCWSEESESDMRWLSSVMEKEKEYGVQTG